MPWSPEPLTKAPRERLTGQATIGTFPVWTVPFVGLAVFVCCLAVIVVLVGWF